jgi:hypothetical protein
MLYPLNIVSLEQNPRHKAIVMMLVTKLILYNFSVKQFPKKLQLDKI